MRIVSGENLFVPIGRCISQGGVTYEMCPIKEWSLACETLYTQPLYRACKAVYILREPGGHEAYGDLMLMRELSGGT